MAKRASRARTPAPAPSSPTTNSNGNGPTANGSPNGNGPTENINPLTGVPRFFPTTNDHREQEILFNALMVRREILSSYLDPRRNINQECGYPETSQLTRDVYKARYERDGIAKRVVNCLSSESWQVQPTIYEEEDVDVETEFERAWNELPKQIRNKGTEESSFFKDEEGNAIWEVLKRADQLSGIGHYGVLLIGIDDGKDLAEPIELKAGAVRHQLLYLRAFDESLVTIVGWELDESNPRYNYPNMYEITFQDITPAEGIIGQPQRTRQVHWTRILHIADNLGSDELFGEPRQRPVWNRLMDLDKMYGGSAEMYWRGAFPGLSIETHPQLGGQVSVDAVAMKRQMEDYQNSLQRYISLMGMSAKSLAPQVVDPTPQIKIQLEAICIELEIPMRVFLGSERGELASGQDDSTWNDRLRTRQRFYLTPRLVVPFVDRMIVIGVLPKPNEGYSCDWPDLESPDDKSVAEVGVIRTDGLVKYIQGGGEAMVLPLDFLTKFMGMEEQEAKMIMENLVASLESEDGEESEGGQTSPLLSLVGSLTGVTEMFKAAGEGVMTYEQLKQSLMIFFKLSDKQADAWIADGEEKLEENLAREADAKKQELEAKAKQPQVVPPGKQPKPGQAKGAGKAANPFDVATNVFCPTGEGGGIDPSCSPGGKGAGILGGTTQGREFELVESKIENNQQITTWKNGLSDGEKAAVQSWSKDGYLDMRTSIGSGNHTESDKQFLSALDKAPNFEGVVYRGLSSYGRSTDPTQKQMAAIENAGIGGTWTDAAPMSSSRSPEIGSGYANGQLLLKIHPKTAVSVEGISLNSIESEVVTKPGVNYKIRGIHTKASLKFDYGKVDVDMLVELEEI